MTLDIYGRQLPAPFAFFDPESSRWRTSRPTLLSDSTPSSMILPRWGMTRGGALYELRTPELLTSEPDCSSLLPTPTAGDEDRGRAPGATRSQLTDLPLLLPTPRTTDANGAGLHGSGGPDLRTAIQLLPTPTAQDAKDSRNSTVPRPPDSTAHPGDTLTDAVTILVGDRTRQRSDDGNSSSAA